MRAVEVMAQFVADPDSIPTGTDWIPERDDALTFTAFGHLLGTRNGIKFLALLADRWGLEQLEVMFRLGPEFVMRMGMRHVASHAELINDLAATRAGEMGAMAVAGYMASAVQQDWPFSEDEQDIAIALSANPAIRRALHAGSTEFEVTFAEFHAERLGTGEAPKRLAAALTRNPYSGDLPPAQLIAAARLMSRSIAVLVIGGAYLVQIVMQGNAESDGDVASSPDPTFAGTARATATAGDPTIEVSSSMPAVPSLIRREFLDDPRAIQLLPLTIEELLEAIRAFRNEESPRLPQDEWVALDGISNALSAEDLPAACRSGRLAPSGAGR